MGNTKCIEVCSGIVDNCLSGQGHIPTIHVCVVRCLILLTVVEVDQRAAALGNKKETILIVSAGTEIRQNGKRIDRILLRELQLAQGNGYKQIVAVQLIDHLDIEHRVVVLSLTGLTLFVSVILLHGVACSLEHALQLFLDCYAGTVGQCVDRLFSKDRVLLKEFFLVVLFTKLIDIILHVELTEGISILFLHLVQPVVELIHGTDRGNDELSVDLTE